MALTPHILAEPRAQGKLLQALIILLSLKTTAIVAIIGMFLVFALVVFSLIIDALTELCYHISQVWNASSSIERLLMFLIAWAFFYKMSPVFARIVRKGFQS